MIFPTITHNSMTSIAITERPKAVEGGKWKAPKRVKLLIHLEILELPQSGKSNKY